MKTCLGCRYAEWDKTKTGRLSPMGDGWCKYEYKAAPMPNAMYWYGAATPHGGHISRKKEFKRDCPCYQQEATK